MSEPEQQRIVPQIHDYSMLDNRFLLALDGASALSPLDSDNFHHLLKRRNVKAQMATYKGEPVGFVVFAVSDNSIFIIRLSAKSEVNGYESKGDIISGLLEHLRQKEGHNGRRVITVPVLTEDDSLRTALEGLGYLPDRSSTGRQNVARCTYSLRTKIESARTCTRSDSSDSYTTPVIRSYIFNVVRADLSDIEKIDAASFPVPLSSEEVIDFVRDRHCQTIVIKLPRLNSDVIDKGELSAQGFLFYKKEEGALRIIRLAIHPECRERHLGKHLMSKVLHEFNRDKDLSSIVIDVSDELFVAHKFFGSLGFHANRMFNDPDRPGNHIYSFQYSKRATP
jgi:ribosomal protein S18 acetylase RimI-like enzyme